MRDTLQEVKVQLCLVVSLRLKLVVDFAVLLEHVEHGVRSVVDVSEGVSD